MADDVKLRVRRSRAHRRGDHSLCRPQWCDHAKSLVAVPELDESTQDWALVGSYEQRLRDAGRLDSADGVHVLSLARLLAAGGHTASGAAVLSRELRAAVAEALKGAPQIADRVDDLAARRRARLRA